LARARSNQAGIVQKSKISFEAVKGKLPKAGIVQGYFDNALAEARRSFAGRVLTPY